MSRYIGFAIVSGFVILSAGSCRDPGVGIARVEFEVTPLELDFGMVQVSGTPGRKTVTVKNLSNTTNLDVKEVVFQEKSPFRVIDPPTRERPISIKANDFITLTVEFAPFEEGQVHDFAIIETSASKWLPEDDKSLKAGEAKLRLMGEGTKACLPKMVVCTPPDVGPECRQPDQLQLDFGYVAVGEPGSRQLMLRDEDTGNCCDLAINDLQLFEEGSECDPDAANYNCKFRITTSTQTPAMVSCGGSAPIVVVFETPQRGEVNGKILLQSNDPDQPTAEIPLRAAGDEPPVCVIEGNDHLQADPGQTYSFDGSQSFDPDDDVPLSYSWTVTKYPETWTGDPNLGTGTTANFMSWQAGQYSVCLAVTDRVGLSSIDPCCVQVDVVPLDDVQVECVWDNFQSDIDCHMKVLGTEWFESENDPKDCYFANCKGSIPYPTHPNWGDLSSHKDDPNLDVDDVDGLGPENITIDEPADGTYLFGVHYWSSHSRQPVLSNVTVRVYIRGQLRGEFFMPLTADCQLWEVFSLDWPSGDITEIGTISLWTANCGGG